MLDKEFLQELKDLSTGRFTELSVDLCLQAQPPFEFVSVDQAKVRGLAYKVAKNILLQVQVTMKVQVECHRCLNDALYVFDFPLEMSLEEKDLECFSVQRWIEEEIVLHSPLQILCSKECQGLCPECGINLNEDVCNCKDRQKNSPFDVLDSLFD